MTDTDLIDALVGFQDDGTGVSDGSEDFTSAAWFSLLTKYKGQESYVGEDTAGNATLQFANVDTTNDQVDIESGFAYVMESGKSVQSGAQSTYDALLPNDVPYVVVLRDEPALENLALDADTVNDVWLALDPTAQDSVYIRHGSGLSAPSDPSVKLGTVDTSTGATTRPNDFAKGAFDSVEANSGTVTNLSTDSVDGGVTTTAIDNFEGANLSVDGNGDLNATDTQGFTSTLVDSGSTTTYTTSDEDVIYVDTSSAAVTITLASADATQGNEIRVVNITGTNSVTVDTEGSETIDPSAEASKSWSNEGWNIAFVSDGTNWDTTLSAVYESVQTEVGSLPDTATDPSSNGEFRRNGADAKVYSGGAVRNLSNVGSSVPDWQEDGNSPLNGSGAQSHTITLSNSYDLVKVIVEKIENESGSDQQAELRMNGDSTSNYSYEDESGASTSGVSEIRLDFLGANDYISGDMLLTGRSSGSLILLKNTVASFLNPDAVRGVNTNVTSPLDSITLRGSSGNITAKARVYGWNGGV